MQALTDNLILGGIHDARPESLGIRLRLGIRPVQAVKVFPLVCEHVALAVILHLAVCALHREAVLERIFGDRIVRGVIDLAVHNRLQHGILGRIDRETSAVEKVMRLRVGIAELILQILLHLAHKFVGKVAVSVGRLLLGNQIGVLNAVVDIVRERCLLLLLGDVTLPQHVAEYHLPLLLVRLPPRNRVEARGVLGDAGEHGALRERQILDLFVEVAPRSHFDAERIAAEVDGIQVVRQDNFLAHDALEFHRKVLLLNFSGQLLAEALFPAAVEEIVFDELLGDGRAAARTRSPANHTDNRAHNGARVDAVVLPEPLVLNRDKGIDQVLRQFLIGRLFAVRARHDQGLHLISGRIVDRSRKAHRGNAVRLELWRRIHNAANRAEHKGHRDCGNQEQQHEHHADCRERDQIFQFAPVRVPVLQRALHGISSKIHCALL